MRFGRRCLVAAAAAAAAAAATAAGASAPARRTTLAPRYCSLASCSHPFSFPIVSTQSLSLLPLLPVRSVSLYPIKRPLPSLSFPPLVSYRSCSRSPALCSPPPSAVLPSPLHLTVVAEAPHLVCTWRRIPLRIPRLFLSLVAASFLPTPTPRCALPATAASTTTTWSPLPPLQSHRRRRLPALSLLTSSSSSSLLTPPRDRSAVCVRLVESIVYLPPASFLHPKALPTL